ncbi:MAG TPA: TetR/AcrR family transcriptional regulator [Negativicutes bacterium]|nr:TetR/AcrR family transcriptional regulator [Negativicutes bacterium]
MDDTMAFRKETILLNTIDVVNESGFQTLSTKEIAKRSGVSEATIFKYYPRKNHLINAVLEHYSQYDSDIFHAALNRGGSPREAIIFFIDSYATYYQNYPAITAVLEAYDTLRIIPGLKSKVEEIVTGRSAVMKRLIERAQEAGELGKEADSGRLAEVLISAFRGICLKWRMRGFVFSFRDECLCTATMLLDAFDSSGKI